MSDTYRYAHPKWTPESQNWPVDGRFSGKSSAVVTRKHQTADRGYGKNRGSKMHRFTKYCRNTRYNLVRKIDALRMKESFE